MISDKIAGDNWLGLSIYFILAMKNDLPLNFNFKSPFTHHQSRTHHENVGNHSK
jgi:hypothetical protein